MTRSTRQAILIGALIGLYVGLMWGCQAQTKVDAPSASAMKTETREKLDPETRAVLERTTTQTTATATGVGGQASGDKAAQNINAQPATAGLDERGQPTATGGGGKSTSSAGMSGSAQKWTLFGLGLLLILAAAACLYFGLRRAALICLIGGAALIFAAFYLGLALFILAGVLLLKFGPYLYAEWSNLRNSELGRATVAAIEAAPEAAKQMVKAEFEKQADDHDRKAYRAVVRKDVV